MKFSTTIVLLTFITNYSFSQVDDMSIFEPLMNKVWKAEESWENGAKFKQEVVLKYNLDKKVVIAKSKGYTDQEQTKFGLRNYGIRQVDAGSGKIKFWEHDVFGGITEGIVYGIGKDIFYEYRYNDQVLTDKWEYVNDSTYNFIIGTMHGDHWHNTYLRTQFRATTKLTSVPPVLRQLVGKWSSAAWDGKLNEEWLVGDDGHLHQRSEYIENDKVGYTARSRIEKVGDELILFSVIKDNDPKIFKATKIKSDEITFENNEYGYPNKVVYSFTENSTFQRTISGKEKGKSKSYTFKFTNR